MRFLVTLMAVLAIAPFVASAFEDGKVAALTAENFDSFLQEQKDDSVLVKFYAPWCGHCKTFAPEFDKAAEQLAGKHKIAKVDCTEHRDLCSTYGVKGFPTVKFIHKDGSTTEYEDARKADAVVKAVIKNSQPAYVVAADAAALEAFKTSTTGLRLVVNAAADSAEAAEVKKAGATLRKDVDTCIFTGATDGKITLYRNFDETEVAFTGEVSAKAIVDFVKSESLPLVGEIGPENFQKYVEKDLPLAWLFVDYTNDEQGKIPAALASVAKDNKAKVIFAKLDGNRWGEHAKTFGLASATPGLAIEDRKVRKNYVFPADQELTAANVAKFIEQYTKGELVANVRSQEPPAENDGNVKIVVGKTYDDIVVNNDKDVFVMFHAPWCGHCKQLSPKWDEVGAFFAANPSIVIAKVDSTENDTPVEVQGFPTLYFFPANDKANPVQYNSERSVDALVKFVKENSYNIKTKGDIAAEAGKDEL